MSIDPTEHSPKRTAGLRGKLAPKQLEGLKTIHEYGAALDSVPTEADVSEGITDWLMLGNGPDSTLTAHNGQPVGDCVPAATAHNEMAKAANNGTFGNGFVTPTADQVVTRYLKFTDGADNGVVIGEWLKWCFDQGLIYAFAPVDYSNADSVHQAMIAFHGVIVGVQLDQSAEIQFEYDQPWTFDGSPTVGGHGILLVSYDPQWDTFVTWGKLQKATLSWGTAAVDEAWVIVSREDAERTGVDIESLLADIRSIPGGQSVSNVPNPSPVDPTPNPTPIEPTPTEPPEPGPSPFTPVGIVGEVTEEVDEIKVAVRNAVAEVFDSIARHLKNL